MSTSGMGSWRNPPLAYVVAEVKFSPFLTLERHVPEFQAGIRDRFPRTREGVVARLELIGNSPTQEQEKVWRFFTENQRLGIDLTRRNVSLHATEYEHFDVFLNSLNQMLSVVEDTIPNLFVEHLGLRYIDYLLPSDTESSFDYIPESLQGVRPPGVSELSECYWIGHFKLASGGINLRVMPRLPAGTFMPPLFGPLDLAPAKTQIEAQKRAAKQEAFGCIDTDRILPIENMLHTAEVVRAFKMMHEDVSNLFQSTMSEKAKKVWM